MAYGSYRYNVPKKMSAQYPTFAESMANAVRIIEAYDFKITRIRFVYTGNAPDDGAEITFVPYRQPEYMPEGQKHIAFVEAQYPVETNTLRIRNEVEFVIGEYRNSEDSFKRYSAALENILINLGFTPLSITNRHGDMDVFVYLKLKDGEGAEIFMIGTLEFMTHYNYTQYDRPPGPDEIFEEIAALARRIEEKLENDPDLPTPLVDALSVRGMRHLKNVDLVGRY
jgi:hypothetical protein